MHIHLQISYDSNSMIAGARLSYHLLEINRVCNESQDEINFHISYNVRFGTSDALLKKLLLDDEQGHFALNKI